MTPSPQKIESPDTPGRFMVTYELDDLLGIGGAWRIRSRTVNVETTGSEAVDLEFV